MRDELTNEELIECLSIPNVPVVQQAILKLIEKNSKIQMCALKVVEEILCGLLAV